MHKFHDVRIEVSTHVTKDDDGNEKVEAGCSLFIDGHHIEQCEKFKLELGSDGIPRATITLIPDKMDFGGNCCVKQLPLKELRDNPEVDIAVRTRAKVDSAPVCFE